MNINRLYFLVFALLVISNHCHSQSFNNGSFIWDLNSNHGYPTFIDVKFKSSGLAVGDDFCSATIENLSNSRLQLSIEFVVTDFCGNPKTVLWAGGATIEPGRTVGDLWNLKQTCKEVKKTESKSTAIASVTCRVTSFRNLTEEAEKAKTEKLRKEQDLAFKKQKEESERTEANRKKMEEEERKRELTKMESERNGNTSNEQWQTSEVNQPSQADMEEQQRQGQLRERELMAQQEIQRMQQQAADREQLANQAGQAAQQFTTVIADQIMRNQQMKFEQEMRLREERRQQEIKKQLEIERAEMRKNRREKLLANFNTLILPREQNTSIITVYGFYVYYDATSITAEDFPVGMSGVCEIGTYKDGSWPTHFEFYDYLERSSGHYDEVHFVIPPTNFTNRSEAEKLRNSFKVLFSKEGTLREANYARSINPSGNAADFWETQKR